MPGRLGDQQEGPGSDEEPTNRTPSFPGEDAMRRMAEACGCGPATDDMAAGCCGDRERSTRTASEAAIAQGEVAG